MATEGMPVRKVTISLPARLVEFADREAARHNTTRSGLIARVLSEVEAAERDRLAAEGYRYYAEEARAFAEASSVAAWEALEYAG